MPNKEVLFLYVDLQTVELISSTCFSVLFFSELISVLAQDKDVSVLNLQSSKLSIVCPTGETAVNEQNRPS